MKFLPVSTVSPARIHAITSSMGVEAAAIEVEDTNTTVGEYCKVSKKTTGREVVGE